MLQYDLPATGYLRLPQIVGNPQTGVPALIPISKSSWWNGIRTDRYPKPIKLSPGVTVWRVEDIRALIERSANTSEAA